MEEQLVPYLRIGAICDLVLEEQMGVLSLIRLIDTLEVTAEGMEVPDELPPGQATITAVMSWVGGLGSYEAKVKVITPTGDTIETMTFPFHLDSLIRAQNIIVKLAIPVQKDGVYWVEFLLGDEVRSRVPWRVLYKRIKHPRPKSK